MGQSGLSAHGTARVIVGEVRVGYSLRRMSQLLARQEEKIYLVAFKSQLTSPANSRYRILGVDYCTMSRSSSPEPPSFVAHPLCPPHLRQLVEDTVQSFDDARLLPPQDGELFNSGKACLDRLQGFALSREFAVVTTSSTAGRYRFGCIHRGKETKNWRKLEDYVQKDPESKQIVSNRQKEKTSQNAHGCNWEMYWSAKGKPW
jgi:hypothetical protein